MSGPASGARRAGRPAYVDEVLDCVERIPPGQVMSYGDIAHDVGLRSARLVGSVLRRYGGEVPWHRVVMADGSPKPFDIGGREQLALLRDDGTPLVGDRVDMKRARVRPSTRPEPAAPETTKITP